MPPQPLSRRDLLLLWRRRQDTGADPVTAAAPTDLRPPPQPLAPLQALANQPLLLRPPGALPEPAFSAACTRCGHCRDVCPAQAIAIFDEGSDAGTPTIDPARQPCVLCSELKCTQVCPSGALQPVTALHDVWMGTAVIETTRCTAWRGLPCRICYEVCPLSGVIAMAPGTRTYVPVAGSAGCTGCSLCQHHCPAEGAIRILPPDDDRRGPIRLNLPDTTPATRGEPGVD